MAFSTIIIIMGIIFLVTSRTSAGSDNMLNLGVVMLSGGLTSLVTYLIGGGTVASLITVLSLLVIVGGAYAVYMSHTKKIEDQRN